MAAETNVLAVFLVEHGRNKEAEACYRQSMDIWERTLGPYSPELASGLNNLAILLFMEDRPGYVWDSVALQSCGSCEHIVRRFCSGDEFTDCIVSRRVDFSYIFYDNGAFCFFAISRPGRLPRRFNEAWTSGRGSYRPTVSRRHRVLTILRFSTPAKAR